MQRRAAEARRHLHAAQLRRAHQLHHLDHLSGKFSHSRLECRRGRRNCRLFTQSSRNWAYQTSKWQAQLGTTLQVAQRTTQVPHIASPAPLNLLLVALINYSAVRTEIRITWKFEEATAWTRILWTSPTTFAELTPSPVRTSCQRGRPPIGGHQLVYRRDTSTHSCSAP